MLSVRLGSEQEQQLKVIASLRGETVSELVRRRILDEPTDQPSYQSVLPVRIRVNGTVIIAVENFEMATAVMDGLLYSLNKHTDQRVTSKDLSIVHDENPI